MKEHTWLQELGVADAPCEQPEVLTELLELARVRRLSALAVCGDCQFRPAHAPALARLLACGCLTRLKLEFTVDETDEVSWRHMVFELSSELRPKGVRALKRLSLCIGSWRPLAIMGVLMSVLTLLCFSLEHLDLQGNEVAPAERGAAGRALGTLIALNSSSLKHLDVRHCNLGDEGVKEMLCCLAVNGHVGVVSCREGNNLSEAYYERDVARPVLTRRYAKWCERNGVRPCTCGT